MNPTRVTASLIAMAALGACSGGGGGDAAAPTAPDNGSPSTPSTPTGPTAAQLAGGWSGTTSQGRPIALLVTSGGIQLMMVSTSVAGSSCTSTITAFIAREPPDTPLALSNGAFTYSSSGSAGSLAMTGTLTTAGTATGTLGIVNTQCNGTLDATWAASRATGPTVDVSGTWNGTFASSLVARTNGTLVLTQSGANVTGTYNLPNGAIGTVSGTVSGPTMTFTLNQTTIGCTGTFSGHAVLMPTPELLVYYYAGSDCLGTHTFGNGSASR